VADHAEVRDLARSAARQPFSTLARTHASGCEASGRLSQRRYRPSACSAYSAVTTCVAGGGSSVFAVSTYQERPGAAKVAWRPGISRGGYQAIAPGTVVVVGGTGSGVNVPPVKMPNRRTDVLVSCGSPYWM
jgi:hypothetical protein